MDGQHLPHRGEMMSSVAAIECAADKASGEGVPRQVDREDAPGTRSVAENSMVRLDTAPADRQSEPEA